MRKNALYFMLSVLFFSGIGFASNINRAPEKIQAALFVKLLSFHQGINGGGDIVVYVIGDSKFASELRQVVGEKIGLSKLSAVNEGSELPVQKPSAIYIGDASKTDAVITYTRSNKVLSITGTPEIVPKGVTLGIGVSGGKPQILLNLSSSKEEGINWDHTILKLAITY